MTHAQWHSRLRQSLAMVERDPAQALKHALVTRMSSAAEKGLSHWHVEQSLEAMSIVHSRLDDHRQSALIMLRVAGLHEQQLTYSTRAFVAAGEIKSELRERLQQVAEEYDEELFEFEGTDHELAVYWAEWGGHEQAEKLHKILTALAAY